MPLKKAGGNSAPKNVKEPSPGPIVAPKGDEEKKAVAKEEAPAPAVTGSPKGRACMVRSTLGTYRNPRTDVLYRPNLPVLTEMDRWVEAQIAHGIMEICPDKPEPTAEED